MSITRLKKQLVTATETYQKLKNILESDKKFANDYSEDDWHAHLRELGQQTVQLIQASRILDNVELLEKLKKKKKKLDRHKNWKKRNVKRIQKRKKNLAKRNAKWIKDVQWKVTMAPYNGSQNKKTVDLKPLDDKNIEDDSIQKDEINKLKRIVSQLLELRTLRRKKLEAKGHFFPDDGDQFFNKVKEQDSIIRNEISENETFIEAVDKTNKKMEIHKEDRWNQLDIDKEAYSYWCGADHSLDKLLLTRKLWDHYIVSHEIQDPFHKVPPTFVIPPPPANAVWASYLI